jgi:hypothetical protein
MMYTEVGIYPIISTGSFYDDLINLKKFFRNAGAIILINVACLELDWPPDLPERSRQSVNPLLPVGVTSLARDRHHLLGLLSQRCLQSSMTL